MAITMDTRGSFGMPTIKCSSCAAEVDLMAMADHVCAASEPQAPAAAPEVTGYGAITAGISSKWKSAVSEAMRPRPPAIDPGVANKPFVGAEEPTPGSSSSSEANLSPSTPNDNEPLRSPLPSPDPASSKFSSGNLTVSSQSSPYSAGSSASNAPKSPLRYLMPMYSPRHVNGNNANLAPASPGLQGPMVLKRMDTIVPGPFSAPLSSRLPKPASPALGVFEDLVVNDFDDDRDSMPPLTLELMPQQDETPMSSAPNLWPRDPIRESEYDYEPVSPIPPTPIAKDVETFAKGPEVRPYNQRSVSPEQQYPQYEHRRPSASSNGRASPDQQHQQHEHRRPSASSNGRASPERAKIVAPPISPPRQIPVQEVVRVAPWEAANVKLEDDTREESKKQVGFAREPPKTPLGLPRRPSEPTIALSSNGRAATKDIPPSTSTIRPPTSANFTKRMAPPGGGLPLNGKSIKRMTPVNTMQSLPESPRLPIVGNRAPPPHQRPAPTDRNGSGRNLQVQQAPQSSGRSSPVQYQQGRSSPSNMQRPGPSMRPGNNMNMGPPPRDNRTFGAPPPRGSSRNGLAPPGANRPTPPARSQTHPNPMPQQRQRPLPPSRDNQRFDNSVNDGPTAIDHVQQPVRPMRPDQGYYQGQSVSDAAFAVMQIKSMKDKSTRATKEKSICRVCNLAIVGEKPIFSSDGKLSGKFHKKCFNCAHCAIPFYASTETGQAVKGEQPSAFFVFENAPYCPLHYHIKNNSLCPECKCGIEGQCRVVDYNSQQPKRYHLHCFCCAVPNCDADFEHGYYEIGTQRYCVQHAPSTKSTRRFTRMMPFI